MDNKSIFIITIIICFFTVCFTYKNENFLSDKQNINENNDDLFYTPLNNIFLGDNYYNYVNNRPNDNLKIPESLNKIKFDSYIYSKPTTQKIICLSHKNVANCWEDNVNNCQWVYKIDNGSYCDVAPIWLL